MGLTTASVGRRAADTGLTIEKRSPDDRIAALAGNPNVGKSTVFNALTGMHQHTGNWPGKTVSCAQGFCETDRHSLILADLPGAYSLTARSAEEEAARDFLCSGAADAVVVVCDAACLERNLNLVLQIMELTERVLVCVNLMDEADRKGIRVDLPHISKALGVPVVGVSARDRKSLAVLTAALDDLLDAAEPPCARRTGYGETTETAVSLLLPAVTACAGTGISPRWLSLRLLEGEGALPETLDRRLRMDAGVSEALARAEGYLAERDLTGDRLRDHLVSRLMETAETLCRDAVDRTKPDSGERDRRIDRILTSRLTGYPVMLGLLLLIFWLTIVGANVPSRVLSQLLFRVQDGLSALFHALGAPEWLHGMLVLGVWRVLAWVVAVMLPPMAIFFPLFALLEDVGVLPRIAYNLDGPFQRCSACGKQALTMCMGFGCNAAGVVGCRIIDSPRERLIAVLTNSFVPCNGRFPTLTALITMFLIFTGGLAGSLLSALVLTGVILLGICMTFAVSRLLSMTVLKGLPSFFTLELPPYRKPQLGRVLLRSMLDRTLFVLGRAASVAAPAGLVIWLMANVPLDGRSLLSCCAGFLDPFGRMIGLDGVLLMAFILGFPANEIVIPIAVMTYMAEGTIGSIDDLMQLKAVLIENGWTWTTAVCTMLFSLFHWPCSTTLLTIRRETGSRRWTILAFLLPTAVGVSVCFLTASAARLFGG